MLRHLKRGVCVGAILIGLGGASVLAQGSAAFDPWQGVQPQVLTDQQFQDVLNVMTAMADADAAGATHGYTPETFHPVAVNATMALSLAGAEAQKQEIENAMATLEGQMDAMPPEQYDQALAQMTAQLSVLNNVPAEILALAAKHQSDFAALSQQAR